MNERWIEDGHNIGIDWRNNASHRTELYYLDIIGLFETSWLTFKFDDRNHEVSNGYPRD